MILTLALLCLVCAATPAALFCFNLRLYLEPPLVTDALPAVSILIPARNEAGVIANAINHALSTHGVDCEVIVMDDGSTDGTADIVLALAAKDARLRLEHAPSLPTGWNGKQHACWALARAARNPLLCFVDADVTLGPDCVARMAQFLVTSKASLVSGFPRQVTGTWLERMLLPLIHFVLLGFLPLARMRAGADPGFAAGCGQFLLARREDYFACGGHSEIKLTMHDGLLLPRRFRAAGFRTDLADITRLAGCRMYTSARQVWNGLAKNATEGLAAPTRIVPITLLFLLGQVLPFALLAETVYSIVRWVIPNWTIIYHRGFIFGITQPWLAATMLLLALVCPGVLWTVRFLGAKRFQQSRLSAFLHPIGILLLLAVQWYALTRKLIGSPVSWRGRAYQRD